MCKKRKEKTKRYNRRFNQNTKRVKQIETNSETSSNITDSTDLSSENESEIKKINYIQKIIDNSINGVNVQAKLKFHINKKWKNVKCDLDTGANVYVWLDTRTYVTCLST